MPPGAASVPPFAGPLFIVGMPRSGTKLLRGLLNRHPQVGIPAAETELLPDWARRWPSFGDLRRPAAFARFFQQVRDSAYFVYLREEQGQEVDPAVWHATCRGYDLPQVFEALLRLDGGIGPDGAGIWGDKSPGYIVHLPLLDRLWPHCRVMHIVRDCRDYCLSIEKAWGKDPLRAAQRWSDRVSLARSDGLGLGPARYLELRYEDLLDRPEAVLRAATDFLGLDFDPAVLSLKQPTENIGDTAGQARIVTENTEKWRTMDPALREQVEALAGDALRAVGYPVAYRGRPERLSPSRMLAGQISDGINLVRSDAADRGWLGAARFRARLFRESGSRDSGR